MAERLPVPGWTRAGETWRVEPETDVRWTLVADGECESTSWMAARCPLPAAAQFANGIHLRLMCADHLRHSGMWIEGGRVVSWSLRAEAPTRTPDTLDAVMSCPNCLTPWKCNGPHLSDQTAATRATP